MGKKEKKQAKKKIREEIIKSLAITLSKYKDGMTDKKFNKTLEKSGRVLAASIIKNKGKKDEKKGLAKKKAIKKGSENSLPVTEQMT